MPLLQFKGKTAVESYHYTIPHHTLEFDPKLSVLEKGQKPGLDGNMIIEGDNLLALKALLPTHAGRVKCIYIDPPYNTGDEGWVYNDNLTQPQFKEWIGQVVGKEGEDACRHDKWCCMMYPRLMLLKELLKDEGALFVSIDENEFHNLVLMLNEIFRVEKPFATFVWKRRSPSGMAGQPVSTDHEYVVMYAKDEARLSLQGLLPDESRYPFEDKRGKYASTDLTIGMTKEERPNQFFDIKNPRTGKVYKGNPDRVWRFEPGKMKEIIEQELVIWPDDLLDRNMTRPRFKTYYDPEKGHLDPVSTWIEGGAGFTRARPIPEESDVEEENGNGIQAAILHSSLNVEGGRALKRIFGRRIMAYPKPPSLIKSICKLATGPEDIVLDSFAGSGTTAQAVLEVNQEEPGHRTFILVQMPHDNKEQEKEGINICQTITAERIRRLLQGYSFDSGKAKKEKVPGLGGSFSYIRLGKPLFGEYRNLGGKLPAYEELAKYIFYTETSHEFDSKAVNAKTGRIGEHKGTAYYLLYTPNAKEDGTLDTVWLKEIGEKEKCRKLVVYCEKLWLHREDLVAWQEKTGRSVRPMLVPFQLK
jgi:adenine-specific DNA-methyltransferase